MSAPNPFSWSKLIMPIPISTETARAAVAALAGLSGQPRVVLEVTGRERQVSWKLGCPAHVRSRVIRALAAQLPGLRTSPLPSSLDGLRADMAAAVKLRGDAETALNQAATETTTRGVLGVLSSTKHGELVHVQLILGPRRRPQYASKPHPQHRRGTTAKFDEHRFACEVRIAASTRDRARSRSLIEGVVGTLRQLEVPGVRLRVTRATIRAFSGARSPLLWGNHLSVSDVVPFLGWPVAPNHSDQLPGVPSPHPRLLVPGSSVPSSGRVVGHATESDDRPIALTTTDSLRHLHLIGPTGVGKSTLMANLALQDIAAGLGVVVIDPKGDLVDDILARADEARLDDVVVLDARDEMPVGINGLANVRDPELAADILLHVFHSLYADSWGPRTHDVMHASLLTLARRGDASLAMVPLLITNAGFRRSIVGKVSRDDPLGLGSFWGWWDQISEAERQQATAPIMRRLRPILMRPGVRGVLGQRAPKFDLSDVFTKRRILLVSLAKGTIGPEASDLLGSLVVSQLWMAALGRTAIPADKRRPVMVHIDELQNYLRLPGDVGDALAQARGLGVGYTLAHQHLGQLPKSIHEGITANARSRVVFQLSGSDARAFAAQSGGQLQPEDFESLPDFSAYAQVLTAGGTRPWVSVSTLPPSTVLRDPVDVRRRSGANYGQSLTDIEADLLSLIDGSQTAGDQLGRSTRRTSKGGQP